MQVLHDSELLHMLGRDGGGSPELENDGMIHLHVQAANRHGTHPDMVKTSTSVTVRSVRMGIPLS